MRIVIIVILMDLFVFALSLVFVDNERQVMDSQNKEYHMDKYGYYWNVK